MRLLGFLTPCPTTRTFPYSRVASTTMRSASDSEYLRRTTASASRMGIKGQLHVQLPLTAGFDPFCHQRGIVVPRRRRRAVDAEKYKAFCRGTGGKTAALKAEPLEPFAGPLVCPDRVKTNPAPSIVTIHHFVHREDRAASARSQQVPLLRIDRDRILAVVLQCR